MQECTDMAEHHQMRERLEFYHQHPLPPFLPRYPVLLGEIWEEEWGREGKECWGGLSIPLTPLLFSPGPLQKVNFRPALANSWPLLLFTSYPTSLSLMCHYNSSSSLLLLFPSSLFLSCQTLNLCPPSNIYWCNKGGCFGNRCAFLRKSSIYSWYNGAQRGM